MTLQEQLADAELSRKEVEDKLNMQSELLQQEMKIRSLKEDELNGAQAILSKLEITLEVLKVMGPQVRGTDEVINGQE